MRRGTRGCHHFLGCSALCSGTILPPQPVGKKKTQLQPAIPIKKVPLHGQPHSNHKESYLRVAGCLYKLRTDFLPSVELLGREQHTPALRCSCVAREQVQTKWRKANQMCKPEQCRKERGEGLGAISGTQSFESHNTSAHAKGFPCAKCHVTS